MKHDDTHGGHRTASSGDEVTLSNDGEPVPGAEGSAERGEAARRLGAGAAAGLAAAAAAGLLASGHHSGQAGHRARHHGVFDGTTPAAGSASSSDQGGPPTAVHEMASPWVDVENDHLSQFGMQADSLRTPYRDPGYSFGR